MHGAVCGTGTVGGSDQNAEDRGKEQIGTGSSRRSADGPMESALALSALSTLLILPVGKKSGQDTVPVEVSLLY
jgi:hypothetical protein